MILAKNICLVTYKSRIINLKYLIKIRYITNDIMGTI